MKVSVNWLDFEVTRRQRRVGATRLALAAILAAGSAASTAGCSSYVIYNPLREYQGTQKPLAAIAIVAKGDTAPCDTDVIGRARSATGYSTDEADVVRMMREKAAQLGADGVKDFECGSPGTIGSGICVAQIYLCK